MFFFCEYAFFLERKKRYAANCCIHIDPVVTVVIFSIPHETGRGLNESCSFHAECVESDRNLQCQDSVCQCTSGFLPAHYTGGNIVCTSN